MCRQKDDFVNRSDVPGCPRNCLPNDDVTVIMEAGVREQSRLLLLISGMQDV